MWLVYAALASLVSSMLSKNKRPYDPTHMPAVTRLRRNVQDIMGDNLLANNRVQELVDDIHSSGVPGFGSLASGVGADPMQNRRRKHRAQRLKKRFAKCSKWPNAYWAKIRCLNRRTGVERGEWVAFFLPHEMLHALATHGEPDALYDETNMDELSKNHLDYCKREAGTRLIGLGLWCDGVPCNWDRTQSVETISMNLPGLSGEYKNFRIPLVSLLRSHIGEHTFDDLFEVITWSLLHCARGVSPVCRHDDKEFDIRYGDRRKNDYRHPGEPIGVRAALCEVRGDWKMMSEVFKFPYHNESAGICWSCPCTKREVVLC